jgi:hypothetical protein
LTLNPIRRVLSILSSHEVRFLLMGGQACIFYGAAEFSRDTDIAFLADGDNLERLRIALVDLDARRIAVPELGLHYLLKGHAIHFRCRRADVSGMRLDVMAAMRGVDPFPVLWERRTTVQTEDGGFDIMALPDLVKAKKTQRDKDWPMVRRLVEAHFVQHQTDPTPEQVGFWLQEARTPSLLTIVAKRFPAETGGAERGRPLLEHARQGAADRLEEALEEEARGERVRDREYWLPLVRELEGIRHEEASRAHARREGPPDPRDPVDGGA